MSSKENEKPVSEEDLSSCTSLSHMKNSKSTSENTSALPKGLLNAGFKPPVLPAYGHDKNFPSASAALKMKGMPPKSLNSDGTPKNPDEVQLSKEDIKRGRHVVS